MALRSINEERLFKKISSFFDRPESVLVELAQNAQRSGALKLDITLEDNILTVQDNGRGADRVEPLFILAESGWDEQLCELQNSAGWGLLFLFTMAREITFRSAFGSITVDCEKYLNSSPYRANILDTVDASDTAEGFYLRAELKKKAAQAILNSPCRLRYFPFDTIINGKPIEKGDIAKEAHSGHRHVISTSFEGNDVFIRPDSFRARKPAELMRSTKVIWYGIAIDKGGNLDGPDVWLDVKQGSPLTPVLPIRTTCKEDEKLEAFYSFVRQKVVDYCTIFINNTRNEFGYDVERMMTTMSAIATQDELDALDRFVVKVYEPYHRLSQSCDTVTRVVRREDEAPVSERIGQLVVKHLDALGREMQWTRDDLEDYLFLPEGVIEEISVSVERPSWLKVEEREYTMLVESCEKAARENYEWLKANRIVCGDKKIATLAMVEGWSQGMFVYREKPSEVFKVSSAVFESILYSDEWDANSYDSQRESFEAELDQDIMRITGTYEKNNLLKGLELAGITTSMIQRLAINGRKMIVLLSDGRKKVLRLAA